MLSFVSSTTGNPLTPIAALRCALDKVRAVEDGHPPYNILSIEEHVREGGFSLYVRCDTTPGVGSVTTGDFVVELPADTLKDLGGNLYAVSEWRPCLEGVMILVEFADGTKKWENLLRLERDGNVVRVYFGDEFDPVTKEILV